MRQARNLVLLAFAAALLPAAPAGAEDLVDRASYWGRLHGAGIYCRRQDTDAFGRRAVAYLQRHADGGVFEAARNAYGVAAVESAQKPPSMAVGGSCAAAVSRFEEALALFGR